MVRTVLACCLLKDAHTIIVSRIYRRIEPFCIPFYPVCCSRCAFRHHLDSRRHFLDAPRCSVSLLRSRPDRLLFAGNVCLGTQCDEFVAVFVLFCSTALAFPLIVSPEVLVVQISLWRTVYTAASSTLPGSCFVLGLEYLQEMLATRCKG
jgi:hypothetical protein